MCVSFQIYRYNVVITFPMLDNWLQMVIARPD